MMVAVFHISNHFQYNHDKLPISNISNIGHVGVDFFFILSGFIILFIHQYDIGKPERIKRFILKRAIRIYPLFWIVLITSILLNSLFSSHFEIGLVQTIKNLLIWPSSSYDLYLGVAWTLKHELVFYALFIFFIINYRLALLIFTCWFALITLTYLDVIKTKTILSSAFNIQFFMGMLIVLLINKVPATKYKGFASLISGIFLLLYTGYSELNGDLNGFGANARILYGASFFLIVLGTVWVEKTVEIAPSKLAILFGQSSYSIYLFHLLINGIIYKMLLLTGVLDMLPLAASATLILISILLISGFVAEKVEKPLLRYLRTRLL